MDQYSYYTKKYFDVSDSESSVESDCSDSCLLAFPSISRSRPESESYVTDGYCYIFEDTPDDCQTSNTPNKVYAYDFFGDSDVSDSEDDDNDSNVIDSDCNTFKLSASSSKSVSNLAEDNVHEDQSEDEVDCANIQNLSICDSVADNEIDDTGDYSKGVLLDEREKILKTELPAKRVRFSPNPPKVHVMRVSHYASKKTLQQLAADRKMFQRRIADIDMAVSWVLQPKHRISILFLRFMPWWNSQRKKEIAEKEEKEAQEKLKEVERLSNEEIEGQNAALLQESKEADKNVSDENTDACISLSQEEATYLGDEELGNSKSNVTAISTEARETDTNIILQCDPNEKKLNEVATVAHVTTQLEGLESF